MKISKRKRHAIHLGEDRYVDYKNEGLERFREVWTHEKGNANLGKKRLKGKGSEEVYEKKRKEYKILKNSGEKNVNADSPPPGAEKSWHDFSGCTDRPREQGQNGRHVFKNGREDNTPTALETQKTQ